MQTCHKVGLNEWRNVHAEAVIKHPISVKHNCRRLYISAAVLGLLNDRGFPETVVNYKAQSTVRLVFLFM